MISTQDTADPLAGVVSPREREVVCQVLLGRRNAEIARTLSISEATVKRHLFNVFQKLGIHRRRELTTFAVPPKSPVTPPSGLH
jgi:two-component system nitrate/nitrite response regulator NarL